MLQGEFGKYKIEKVVGMGGMSIVYRAFDQSLNRETALKVLNVRRMGNPLEIRRFQRELEITQRLRHPNIIDIYEYGEVENFAYLAMEFMPGGSLAERYANPVHLTLGESAELLKVIASALDFAHAEGVLHRDLKLSNILIAADGRLTLSDFGLALMQDESRITRTGQTFGTPVYMSPEQVNGVRNIDYRADIYSFAVIAYLLATGYFPFMTSNTMMILNQQLRERAPLPSKLNPLLPEGLNEVLLKGLSKKPEERYASAGALARAFSEVVAGIEDTEIVILTSQPTPIIESSNHYAFKSSPSRSDDKTYVVRDWQGEITPDFGELDDLPVAGVAAEPAAAESERRVSRWAVGTSLVAAAFVVLVALGAILPPPRSAPSSDGLESTREPTLVFQPSATVVFSMFDQATPTLPVLVGLSTAIAERGNSEAQPTIPVDTETGRMIDFILPTATTPPTVTSTDELTMAMLASTEMRATQRADETAAAIERRVTPTRTFVPDTVTPTPTPTWHEVYVMATPPPTTAGSSSTNQAAQPTTALQNQSPQSQAQPTAAPATAPPATNSPGLAGSLPNSLLAPIRSLLPTVGRQIP
jgi:serine/threonine protein kinase